MHSICWLTAIISTLLPLSTQGFGRDDDSDDPLGWCYITTNLRHPTYGQWWALFTFILILLFCVILMTYFSIRIYWRYTQFGMGDNYPEVRAVVNATSLYPIAMLLFWGPNVFFALYLNVSPRPSLGAVLLFDLSLIWAMMFGVACSLIFITKSKEAQHRWVRLLLDGVVDRGTIDGDGNMIASGGSPAQTNTRVVGVFRDYIGDSSMQPSQLSEVMITTTRNPTRQAAMAWPSEVEGGSGCSELEDSFDRASSASNASIGDAFDMAKLNYAARAHPPISEVAESPSSSAFDPSRSYSDAFGQSPVFPRIPSRGTGRIREPSVNVVVMEQDCRTIT